MAGERNLTLQEAVGDFLGITLARHPTLRNAVNTLAKALDKAKLISLDQVSFEYSASDNKKLTVAPKYRTCLINAVLIQGVFSEPKTVIKILTDQGERVRHAEWAKALLIDQQSVAGQGFLPSRLGRFFEMLAADVDLKAEQLPNPFADTLPQMGLGPSNSTSLLRFLAAQSAVLSQGNSMMAYYLDGDLEKAYQAALEVRVDSPVLMQYRELIMRDYRDAQAVSDLLKEWR